ncbi:hypothetical protein QZH41_009174, partial [Actinostola sp. cb2023]
LLIRFKSLVHSTSLHLGAFAEVMIGNCNRTFFAHGSTLCQRAFAENLVLVKESTCESEYKRQISGKGSCVERHVKTCLAGTPLEMFWAYVVDLIKHVVINCGSVTGDVNVLLLQQLKCPSAKEAFTRTKNCWTEFASKVKANKSDPTLCNVYATAKHCVANITNKECPEVNMEKDHCNPFCANRTDDHRECPVMPISLICKREFYFEKEKECEKKFIEGLTGSAGSSCSTEVPKLVECVKDQYKECFFPRVDNALLQKLQDAMARTSSAQRLFCNATPLNVTGLPSTLRDMVACKADFYIQADNCVEEFREAYSNKKADNNTLCRTYESAKSCLYKAQENHCQHSPALLLMVNETYNPFTCENKKDPTSGSEMRAWSRWFTLAIGVIMLCVYK